MNWAIFETPIQRGAHSKNRLYLLSIRHFMHEQDSIFHGTISDTIR